MKRKKLPPFVPKPRSVCFTTYDAAGEVLRVVTCPPDHVKLQRMRTGERMTMGKADSITQKVVDKKIVNKTAAEMKALRKANPKLRFDTVP